ncbi:MAG: hypothetical protein K0S34_335 [Bacillales bacterium]|jgi:hypothetical protein|nr:hypothetical protein [Bacillales bacterium]
MYASINVHFLPVLHYTFAFAFLFLMLPSWLFKTNNDSLFETIITRYVKMTFVLISVGYIMVITKLFEVIALLLIFLGIVSFRYIQDDKKKNNSSFKITFLKRIFDTFDGIFRTNKNVFKAYFTQKTLYFKDYLTKKFSWSLLLELISLFIIVMTSIYIRFYDAFVNAAPPMADSYVTLAWMKYIDARELFHDGIYPQGFHIYLATLLKFSAIDPLFILRYTGPLNAILLIVGYYAVVRKVTNNGIGALAAVFIAGVLPSIYPFYSIERQAATNSQEFAFIFIFPAVYFIYKYFLDKEKNNLLIGLISTTIVGLVHALAFALVGLLIGILCFSSLIVLKNRCNQVIYVCSGAIATVIFSAIPLGFGFLLNKKFHESSAEYLVETNKYDITFPELGYIDYATLILLFLLLWIILIKKTSKEIKTIALFSVFTGSLLFALYYFGGVLTESTLITSRSIELWAIVIPFCIGISISAILNVKSTKYKSIMHTIILVSVISILVIYKPQPIIPYKLEYSENIEQYLRITENYRPKMWIAISQDEGYSVSLGSGYHMHLGDFLKTYDANSRTLTRIDNGKIDDNLPSYVFIFLEKKIFKVSKSNSIYQILEPEYNQREEESKTLKKWINIHKKFGNKIEVFYDNKNITVYKLEMPKAKEEMSKKIWND